jgi:hypothetical protein
MSLGAAYPAHRRGLRRIVVVHFPARLPDVARPGHIVNGDWTRLICAAVARLPCRPVRCDFVDGNPPVAVGVRGVVGTRTALRVPAGGVAGPVHRNDPSERLASRRPGWRCHRVTEASRLIVEEGAPLDLAIGAVPCPGVADGVYGPPRGWGFFHRVTLRGGRGRGRYGYLRGLPHCISGKRAGGVTARGSACLGDRKGLSGYGAGSRAVGSGT